jgi:transmembrane sensor
MHVAAEAADWIARLHGPGRSRQMERECLAWQSRSQAHRHAFECCATTWEDVRGTSFSAHTDTSAPPLLRSPRC